MAVASKLTPAMEQYQRFKRQHSDAILFFRMGDFYEMFFEDAREAAALLGLTLTRRNHGKQAGDVPLAGVPHHAMEGYLARLIRLGRKVAICEQVEDPRQAKGVVKRDVVQVVSPGTALSDAILERHRNNYLAALCAADNVTGMALVDLSTGEFLLAEIASARLGDELTSLTPAELLLPEDADAGWLESIRTILPETSITRVDRWQFNPDAAYRILLDQLDVQSLKGFDCEDLQVAVRAGGAAIQYLRDNQRNAVAHINTVVRRRPEEYLVVDATAQRNLELIDHPRDGGPEQTLLGVLDQTCTPMGARLLRSWVVAPLKNAEAINARLDAVQELHQRQDTRARLRDHLRSVGDVERLISRICCQRANARDLVALARSLATIPAIRDELRPLDAACNRDLLETGLPDVQELVRLIQEALVDEPPLSITEGNLIRDGHHPEVDELRQASSGGKEFIAGLQNHERERTGIASLKVGFNQVFGYYIEASKANLDRIPADYVRKQTLVNAERYITPELKEYEARVLGAEERLESLENQLFLELRQQTAAWTPQVQHTARTLARLDVLASLAEVAHRENYVRPHLDEGTELSIQAGRHPVVERQMRDGRFVPNDTRMNTASEQILLVTGPNMAGKSTVIRQVGLIVLMAQMGGFVPARAAHIGVVDRIFTRVGAADNLARGESTFMVEMNEAASIVNNVTDRSLVLIDELGRGTSTYDGLSIAWAIVEYLHDQPGRQARTLFATHYHEMTQLADQLERVVNYNVLVHEEAGHVVFLHRLERGPCDRSYGIHVAQMAGMPGAVIRRARDILTVLERPPGSLPGNAGDVAESREQDGAHFPVRPAAGGREEPVTADDAVQLELFPGLHRRPAIESELLALELDLITPLQALTKLQHWQQRLRHGQQAGDR